MCLPGPGGGYLPGPGGVPAWPWGDTCLVLGGGTCLAPGGVPAWSRGRGYLPGPWGGVPAWPWGGCTCLVWGGVTCMVPGGCTWSGTPRPWTEFLTHASENITLPQTSFADGNNSLIIYLYGDWKLKMRLQALQLRRPLLLFQTEYIINILHPTYKISPPPNLRMFSGLPRRGLGEVELLSQNCVLHYFLSYRNKKIQA